MTQSIGLDEGKGHHHPITVSAQVSSAVVLIKARQINRLRLFLSEPQLHGAWPDWRGGGHGGGDADRAGGGIRGGMPALRKGAGVYGMRLSWAADWGHGFRIHQCLQVIAQ